MKKTYVISVESKDEERNNFLRKNKLDRFTERFFDDAEAEIYIKLLNATDSYKYFKETARIERKII